MKESTKKKLCELAGNIYDCLFTCKECLVFESGNIEILIRAMWVINKGYKYLIVLAGEKIIINVIAKNTIGDLEYYEYLYDDYDNEQSALEKALEYVIEQGE